MFKTVPALRARSVGLLAASLLLAACSGQSDSECPQGTVELADGACGLPPCPTGQLRDNAGQCVSPPLSCPDGFTAEDESCAPPSCPSGFERVGANCVDVDECAQPALNDCDEEAVCTNTAGSFTCACPAGWSGDGKACTPACEPGCGEGATCAREDGASVCTCPEGYALDAARNCVDVDECQDAALNDCDPHAVCENTDGGWTCACPENFEGDGQSCTPICEEECGENQACTALPEGNACACAPGYEDDGEGACVDIDECASAPAIEFTRYWGEPAADCIIPGVCLTRNDTLPLFNAARELIPVQWLRDTVIPSGTLWASSRCEEANPEDFDFLLAASNRRGDNIVNRPVCLFLPETEAYHDVLFTAWASDGDPVEAGDDQVTFRYTRQATHVCGTGEAVCTNTPGSYTCECPAGRVFDAERGECVFPDLCADNPCGEGARCSQYQDQVSCQCDVTRFSTREGGEGWPIPSPLQQDCLDETVCLTRGTNGGGLFNAVQESSYDNSGDRCEHVSPAGVIVAAGSCAEAAAREAAEEEDVFGTWNSALVNCKPPAIVGQQICVEIAATGARWDLTGLAWEADGSGAMYERWRTVAPGEACGQ